MNCGWCEARLIFFTLATPANAVPLQVTEPVSITWPPLNYHQLREVAFISSLLGVPNEIILMCGRPGDGNK